MSIMREALRLTVVRALRGRTWADVRDSEQGAIEDLAVNAARPVISVYTDDGTTDDAGDVGLFAGSSQSILIEIAMTARMQLEASTETEIVQPETDASLELSVGMIERQVRAALSDPTSPWGDLFTRFGKVTDFKSVRGTLMREGVRFAGRQVQITLALYGDPAPGAQINPGSTLGTFLALLEASPEPGAAKTAQAFRDAVAGNAGDWFGWQRDVAEFALGNSAGRALGLLPPAGITDAEPEF
ncbi:MAG: hypothetical protein B7Y80_01495 [Hyphomicrobium sp. 32-62-53]|nr:MAG: hypothetical protein B7Z29_01845 [Hyphomicrobium sp. 12-62-95]OYY01428.1 MAG: hypothetical protein B7Y80_01495 [Hyphomicrobium sp. 32-62-53]